MSKERVTEVQAEPCLYCGKPATGRDYIINPKANRELPCCSKECLAKTKSFVAWDNKVRNIFYVILFAFVAANLFIFGFHIETRWAYLPMLGIGAAVCFFPTVFKRYERYQKMGIQKTQIVIRIIAVLVILFALVLTIAY